MSLPYTRRQFLATTALLPAALVAASDPADRPPPACPLGNDWTFTPAFSDEFDGPGLDDTKWWDFNPAWHGRKPSHFSRANVRVADGSLQLTARVPDPATVSVEDRVRGYGQFTTAIVKSKSRLRYGYFEARCRSMRANVCNAFWLYDPLDAPVKYREGEGSEEIDIFEVFGNPPRAEDQRMCFATVHRYLTPYVESLVNAKKTPLPQRSAKVKMPFDFWADFHVYGLRWTPQDLTWYVDGREIFTRPNDLFHRPLHVVFDAEIMQDWTGLPNVADLPATFAIDYVRIWQQPG